MKIEQKTTGNESIGSPTGKIFVEKQEFSFLQKNFRENNMWSKI